MKNENISQLVRNILDKYGIRDMEQFLDGKMKMSDMQWVVMQLYQNMVKRVTPASLLQQYRENRFTVPCDISPKDFLKLEAIIYDLLPKKYIPIELAPVMPFGSNAVLARINQGNVLSTVRNIEVTADITMAMAIEAASRLAKGKQENREGEVHLCSSQRCLRLQKGTDKYGFTPHFKVFALFSSWRRKTQIDSQVYVELYQQLEFYLHLLNVCRDKTYRIGKISVEISDMNVIEEIIKRNHLDREAIRDKINDASFNFLDLIDKEIRPKVVQINNAEADILREIASDEAIKNLKKLEADILNGLRNKYPTITFAIDLSRIAGLGYYNGPCFKIYAETTDGTPLPLADGGTSDWLTTLVSDKRRAIFTSGFGLELFCRNLSLPT